MRAPPARTSRFATTSMRPPLGNGSMPCLTAFSTSVISMPGGTRVSSSSPGIAVDHESLEPKRVCMMRRYAEIMSTSCFTVVASSWRVGIVVRRNRIRSLMRRAASGAFFSASCCALPSVLNRKCGSICNCRSFSFDSANCRERSLWRFSASRLAASARYSRLRRLAMSATMNVYMTPKTSAPVTMCRKSALS